MLSLTVLASGSSGNCALVETEQTRVLIDAGISCRQICKRLQAAGVTPLEIDAVVITHEHSDHVSGLPVFCRQFHVPVYANGSTSEVLRLGKMSDHGSWRIFSTGEGFSLKDLTLETFSVPHDAVEPVGLVMRNGGSALGILTDLGFATHAVMDRIRDVALLLVETNHDEELLARDTKRPWPVKQRIMSRHGHLSNAAAAGVVEQLLGRQLRRAILGHLSRDCNTPAHALAAVRGVWGGSGPGASGDAAAGEGTHAAPIELHCAGGEAISPRFHVA